MDGIPKNSAQLNAALVYIVRDGERVRVRTRVMVRVFSILFVVFSVSDSDFVVEIASIGIMTRNPGHPVNCEHAVLWALTTDKAFR